MRVAILADPIDNQNAGVHVYTRELVHAMLRNNPGHELLIIREKNDPELNNVKQIPVWNTRLPLGFASLRLFFLVPFILHRNKVDVVIEPAHFGPFNLSGKIKRVTIIHDLTPILFSKWHRWHSQVLQKIFLKSILNKSDLIISNSDHTTKDICKVYPQNCNKVKRIYPGKNKSFKPETKPGVLEKYQIHHPYFIFVGTIEPRKNLLSLLEAFRKFKEQHTSDFILLIAGGTGWKAKPFFDALANHPYKDEIICTGFVDAHDLPTLYTNAEALIYPSLYEGFGLPIVEAMSCGTPVIAANNSSLPEAGGDPAFYFNAEDSGELAMQMTKFLNDRQLRGKLSAGMQQHVAKFDWDNAASDLWMSIAELK